MNMIRLWGGGQYEKDCFYEICDELGVLVWHDHMFSCAVYPADEAFLSEVEMELSHQLRRLRDTGGSSSANMLFFNILTETKTMILHSRNIMKSLEHFVH